MNDRIIELRKILEITQEAFASRIGLSRNYIWMIENGDRIPSDRTISDICREFNVNDNWLRTGEGEMFKNSNQMLAEFIGKVINEQDSFRYRLISVLSRTTPEEWKMLESFITKLIEEYK